MSIKEERLNVDNNKPLVSIGIPAYNGASKLKGAIESAIAQDYANIELVISDDASKDDTPALCQEYCQRDNRIRYVRQPKNLGLTDNFAAVFKESRGEFFMWLSQDDTLEPTYVSQCVNFLLENPDYSLVCGQPRYFLDEKFLFIGDRINLPQDSARERILNFYAQVLDNGALYAVMRRHQLAKWLMPKTMNGDWILVASLVFQGKLKTLETVSINRQNRWTKPQERAREFAEGEGLPLYQATKPGISAAIAAFKDIAYLSPTYAPLGQLGRFLLAWEVLQVFIQKRKVILTSKLLFLSTEVDGKAPEPLFLTELRQVRKQVADFWLITPAEQLSSAYAGNLGKLESMLLFSGIKDEPLTEAEKAFVSELKAQISRGFQAPNAIQYLLAAWAYCYAHQLPLSYEGVPIPKWLFEDYIKFTIESPEYFQEIGEVDNYYRHCQRWLSRLHSNIFKNPDSKIWQNQALFFSDRAKLLFLYFTSANLKDILIQRAEILEFALKLRGNQIDYAFPERGADRRKIRLGILKYDFKQQTETFTTIPVFEHLDREKFEIILYACQTNGNPLEKYCQSRSDRLAKLPKELDKQVQSIRSDDLDILLIATCVTSEVNPITLLALHRLARVQLTCYSSPVTTGMRNIDYYISGKLAEPAQGAQELYREQLIALEGAGTCFSYYAIEPDAQTRKPDRQSLGVADKSIVFMSGANFYKIVPELRETWAKIVAAVPDSVLVLYPFSASWGGSYPALSFMDSMKAVFAKYGLDENRLIILETLPNRSDVKEYLKLGDVYLDSYPYSGSNSTVDPLEVGLPTVVMDGNSLRSRQGAALLRELEITDLIADSEEAYIQLAVALATDAELRHLHRDRILQKMANNPKFLDSRSYALQIGAVFQDIFQKHAGAMEKRADSATRATTSIDFVKQLAGNVNLYQIDPSNQSALADIRLLRLQIANLWLNAEPNNLAALYAGELGKAHKLLLNSGVKKESLTQIETKLVEELTARLAKGFEEPKALQSLLAVTLYRYAHQLSLQYEALSIPEWFSDDYHKFAIDCPPYFQEIGEVDSYSRHLQRWVGYLHTNIFKNPASKEWQKVASFFTESAYFVPLYFTTTNQKDIFTQRAEIGEFVLKNRGCQLDYVFPERPASRRKIRLGILKLHFNPQTETFAILPTFEHLDKARFEIILYTFNVSGHPLEQYCQSRADRVVTLPDKLNAQVQAIRADDLDILLIGSNVTAVTTSIGILTLHRLARVQIASSMSPVTTGRRHADYYLAGTLTAPKPDSSQHYREQLITIEGSGLCFSNPLPPEVPTIKPERKSWGASDSTIVFISGANFYKIIPELRETWAKIIAAVPNSVLVLYPFNPNWAPSYPATLPFVNRMRAVFSKYGIDKKRLVVVKTLPKAADIKECLKLADVYLDSFPYSGATSLVDALEIGLPTVAMDGNVLRARQAAALLRELQVSDLIADSEEAYIRLAVALATNPDLRRQKRQQIQQQMSKTPSFIDSRAYAIKIAAVFQEIFQEPQETSPEKIDLDSHDTIEIGAVVQEIYQKPQETRPEKIALDSHDTIEVEPRKPAIASIKTEPVIEGAIASPKTEPVIEGAIASIKTEPVIEGAIASTKTEPVEAATEPVEGAIASLKFLNQLIGCVNLYQIDPSDESILNELRQIRKQIADFWLSAATEQLETLYVSNVGKGHKTLIQSGILEEPQTEAERTFASELLANIAKGFEQPKALNELLAAMLYYPTALLHLPENRTSIPEWLQLS